MHRRQELNLIRGWLVALPAYFANREMNVLVISFRSPTMAGGLLAAHREYFFEIGGYGKDTFFVEIDFSNFACFR